MKPEISICCITYNQREYVVDMLEGFVLQSMFLDCEVIIHDDGSTDGTLEVLREYEARFPDRILVVSERENLWGAVGNYLATFCFPRARGRYIAICEGDDYWISSDKLRRQYEYMEEHTDYSLCVHGAKVLGPSGFLHEFGGMGLLPDEDADLAMSEVIRGGGGLLPTASMVFRRRDIESMPRWWWEAPVGDYPLAIWLSGQGKVRFISEKMSVYRYMARGSWTAGQENGVRQGYYLDYVKMLEGAQRTFPDFRDLIEAKVEEAVRAAYAARDIASLSDSALASRVRFMSLSMRCRVMLSVLIGRFGYAIKRVDGKVSVCKLEGKSDFANR